jgi:hypothetical protein
MTIKRLRQKRLARGLSITLCFALVLSLMNLSFLTIPTTHAAPGDSLGILDIQVNKPVTGVVYDDEKIDISLPYGTLYQMLNITTNPNATAKLFRSDETTEIPFAEDGMNKGDAKLDQFGASGSTLYYLTVSDKSNPGNNRKYTVTVTVDRNIPAYIADQVGPKDKFVPLNIRAGEHAWDVMGASKIGNGSTTGSVEGPDIPSSYSGKPWYESVYDRSGDYPVAASVYASWLGDNMYLQTLGKNDSDMLTDYGIADIPGTDKLDSDILRFHTFTSFIDSEGNGRDDGDRGAPNSDRQRLEIKSNTNASSIDANAVGGDIMTHRWKLMLPSETLRFQNDTANYQAGDFIVPRRFFHIFQLKEVSGNATSQPVTTLSLVSYDNKGYLEFRNNPDGDYSDRIKPLFSIPLEEVVDRWLDFEVTILNADNGYMYGKLVDLGTDKVLYEGGDTAETLRRPEEVVDGRKQRTDYPVDSAQQNRSKWGLYRGMYNTEAESVYADEFQSSTMYVSDVHLIKRDRDSYVFPDGWNPHTQSKQIVAWERPSKISASPGTAFGNLELPSEIAVTLSTGKIEKVNVTWSEAGYDASKEALHKIYGEFGGSGVSNPKNIKPYIEVNLSSYKNWAVTPGASIKVVSQSGSSQNNFIDDKTNTTWVAHSSLSKSLTINHQYWAAIKLEQKIDIDQIDILWANNAKILKNYQVYYTNDGAAYDELTQGSDLDKNPGQATERPLDTPNGGSWTPIPEAKRTTQLTNNASAEHKLTEPVSAQYLLLLSDVDRGAASGGLQSVVFRAWGLPSAPEEVSDILDIQVNKPANAAVNGDAIDISLPYGTLYQMLNVTTNADVTAKLFRSDGITEISFEKDGINQGDAKLDQFGASGSTLYYLTVSENSNPENNRKYTVTVTVDRNIPAYIADQVGPKDKFVPLNIRAGEHAWDVMGASKIGNGSTTGSVEGPDIPSSYSGKPWYESVYDRSGDYPAAASVDASWLGDNMYLQILGKNDTDKLTDYGVADIPGTGKLDSDILRFHTFTSFIDSEGNGRDDGDRGAPSSDRQRLEIKSNTSASSIDANAVGGDIMTHRWKLMLPSETLRFQNDTSNYKAGDYIVPRRFFHIFQLKEVAGNATSQPVTTLSLVSYDNKGYLEFRNNPDGDYSDRIKPLFSIPLEEVVDRWLDFEVTILNADHGYMYGKLVDLGTDKVLYEGGNTAETLRRPEEVVDGRKQRTDYPVIAAQQNRSKWGLYRGMYNTEAESVYADEFQSATMYVSDIDLIKRDRDSYIFPDGWNPHTQDKEIVAWERPSKISASPGTSFGDLELPSEIAVTLSTGKIEKVNVTWSEAGYDASKEDLYKIYGEFGGSGVSNPMSIKPYIEVNLSGYKNWAVAPGASIKVVSQSGGTQNNFIDDNSATTWAAHSSLSRLLTINHQYWAAIKLEQPIDVDKIEIEWANNARILKNYQVYYANDGAAFDELTQGSDLGKNPELATERPLDTPNGGLWKPISEVKRETQLTNNTRASHTLTEPVRAQYLLLVSDVDRGAASGGIQSNVFRAYGVVPSKEIPNDPDDGEDEDPTSGTPAGSVTPPLAESNGNPGEIDLEKDAKVTKETIADGKVVTKVAVDAARLEKALENPIVKIEVKDSESTVNVELPASAMQIAISSQGSAVIQIQTNGVNYELPVSLFANLPKESLVSVTISQVTGKAGDDVDAAVKGMNAKQVVSNPIEFTIAANGVEMSDFDGVYVNRTISLGTLTVDPNKVSAVWVDANNQFHFVPAIITTKNGISEITIRSPHNSVYTVIQSDKSFADLEGHWARADVELLANKWVVNGKADAEFVPDSKITRAEFAAMLVRSLGLLEAKTDRFHDVESGDWFAGAVGAAYKAGLIEGYEDGTFKPNADITREQMAVMTIRAMEIGGKEIKGDAASINRFSDRSLIGDWSRQAIAQALAASIIQGMSDNTFAPNEQATRAQASTMLKRMLQSLQFIN